MTFERTAFLALMPASVQITPFRRYSTDGYTKPTYTTAVSTYRARVALGVRLDVSPDGRSVTPTHTAWVATTTLIDVRSRFSYLGSTYRMVRSYRIMDQDGPHHTKLEFVGG